MNGMTIMGDVCCHKCSCRANGQCSNCDNHFCSRHGTECDGCGESKCSACLSVFEELDAVCIAC